MWCSSAAAVAPQCNYYYGGYWKYIFTRIYPVTAPTDITTGQDKLNQPDGDNTIPQQQLKGEELSITPRDNRRGMFIIINICNFVLLVQEVKKHIPLRGITIANIESHLFAHEIVIESFRVN